MIRYKIKGDIEPIELSGPEDLVHHMNETAEFKSADAKTYMLDYAKRSVVYRNVDIRATDYFSFVEDLIKYGDVEQLNN